MTANQSQADLCGTHMRADTENVSNLARTKP